MVQGIKESFPCINDAWDKISEGKSKVPFSCVRVGKKYSWNLIPRNVVYLGINHSIMGIVEKVFGMGVGYVLLLK